MMDEKRDYSKECGIRCRQIRMSKGMSQQALAEMVNVTAQAVSKWEKEGISNIDHIMKLSNVLGQDITADQFDHDGTLTEIGKEILKILINNQGYVDFDTIENSMYGMKKDRIGNELFKLERIGAVIREQFVDFCHNDRDGIFITAKGVIVYKNSLSFPNFINEDVLEKVVTIDERLDSEQSSFQEVIDNDKVTDVLINIKPIKSAFRCDYLKSLYEHRYNPIIDHHEEGPAFFRSLGDLLVGQSCYIDILRRMAQGTKRKELDSAIRQKYIESFEKDPSDIFDKELIAAGVDWEDSNAVYYFCNVIRSMPHPYDAMGYDERFWDYESDNPDVQQAIKELHEEEYPEIAKEFGTYKKIIKKLSENEEKFFSNLDYEEDLLFPACWFSYDEIKKFIEDNILPPADEEEKVLDDTIKKIWEIDRYTRKYYYSFPERWEKNGLAKLIRERVGMPYTEQYEDEHYWDGYMEEEYQEYLKTQE